MRELVYLSERKLKQFQAEERPRRWWRRISNVGATAPLGLGGLQVGLANQTAADHPTLAQVIRDLERSSKPPRWIFEDGVRAGDWVKFRAELSYQVFSDNRFSGAPPALEALDLGRRVLLFWEPWGPPEEPQSTHMMLLHGSADHLSGSLPMSPPVSGDQVTGSSSAGLVDFLTQFEDEPLSLSGTIWRALSILGHSYPSELAIPMSGYARVTANVPMQNPAEAPRVVVASPLFVEVDRQ